MKNSKTYTPIETVRSNTDFYKNLFLQVKPQNRFFDILLSTILIIIFSPIMLGVQIQILIDDGRPIIYKQYRVGLNNKPILIHKFRSMTHTDDDTPQYVNAVKYRITKVGKFIRKVRFDELLQLFDVLNGQMSLIGPRPEQVYFSKEIEKMIPEYSYRFNVKPGITGWAQINWKYQYTSDDQQRKLEYDLYYMEHKGFKMSLKIIFKSVWVMLKGQGE